jgi:hypothetical protein
MLEMLYEDFGYYTLSDAVAKRVPSLFRVKADMAD